MIYEFLILLEESETLELDASFTAEIATGRNWKLAVRYELFQQIKLV